jgi:methionyl-tRNA formyltransferase
LSIIFFGTPEFALPSFWSLMNSGEKISLVVTQTDKVKGRGHKLSPPPVKTAALGEGIKVAQPGTLRDDKFIGELRSLKPDFIVVIAYGKILPGALLEIPENGCINVHASLLPKYRGAAPIAWAILRGEEKTGITTMRMDEGLDTGPILLQREADISRDDTAGSLSITLARLGASLLIETLIGVRNGSVKPRAQSGEVSYAPPLRKEDGLIDWSRSAVEIRDFVRGMQPWPSAYCMLEGERVTVLKAGALEGSGLPGSVTRTGKGELVIGTGKGLISLLELQPSGKRPMPASAFLLGRKLMEGMVLK